MSIKGVKLKSESFFSISPGVLELWRKNLRGGGRIPPPPVQIGLIYEFRLSQLHVELSASGPEAKQEITIFTFGSA